MDRGAAPYPIRHISKTTVKPQPSLAPRRLELTPWDLTHLTVHYIQKAHIFALDSHDEGRADVIIERLKASLSTALHHFYPLAGRLATEKSAAGISLYLDCSNHGVDFIHAAVTEDGVSIADITGLFDGNPPYFNFFPLNDAISHDGHSLPVLAVQATELADGIFLAFAFNHCVTDGTSMWYFLRVWAEICRSGEGGIDGVIISNPPTIERCFIDGGKKPVVLPFEDGSEFIHRFTPTVLTERRFSFTPASLSALKATANSILEPDDSKTSVISSFQSLTALIWRAVTRARRLPGDEETRCFLAANARPRLDPPLSPFHIGCYISEVLITATAGDILAGDHSRAALLVHRAVASQNDSAVRKEYSKLAAEMEMLRLDMFKSSDVMLWSSPRFDMYDGCDFGWGRPVAIRAGIGNRLDGRVSANAAQTEEGGVDVEMILLPKVMAALEGDEEFMRFVSIVH